MLACLVCQISTCDVNKPGSLLEHHKQKFVAELVITWITLRIQRMMAKGPIINYELGGGGESEVSSP